MELFFADNYTHYEKLIRKLKTRLGSNNLRERGFFLPGEHSHDTFLQKTSSYMILLREEVVYTLHVHCSKSWRIIRKKYNQPIKRRYGHGINELVEILIRTVYDDHENFPYGSSEPSDPFILIRNPLYKRNEVNSIDEIIKRLGKES